MSMVAPVTHYAAKEESGKLMDGDYLTKPVGCHLDHFILN